MDEDTVLHGDDNDAVKQNSEGDESYKDSKENGCESESQTTCFSQSTAEVKEMDNGEKSEIDIENLNTNHKLKMNFVL